MVFHIFEGVAVIKFLSMEGSLQIIHMDLLNIYEVKETSISTVQKWAVEYL